MIVPNVSRLYEHAERERTTHFRERKNTFQAVVNVNIPIKVKYNTASVLIYIQE